MVILVFPCFPMCFTFSLLLYINIGNELTYPPFIDKSILKKMLVGNSRNFPFCNFKIHFLIIWEIYIYIYIYIYDCYISISWEYYIPFLHYHIYIYPIISIPFWRNISVPPPGSVGELQLAIATPEAPAELQARHGSMAMAMASLEQNSQRNLFLIMGIWSG